MMTRSKGALNRRELLLTVAAAALGSLASPALAERSNSGDVIITNFNHRRSQATTVTEVVTDPAKAEPMLSLNSKAQLEQALARYQSVAASGGWPMIEGVETMSKGGRGPLVVTLRQRLAAEGYLPPEAREGEKFDAAVQAAVVDYQAAHGLAQTGFVEETTLAELNVPAAQRVAQIQANIARVELYVRELGPRYVTVNIPAIQLEAVNLGRVYSRHNIIAGKPDRPSPVVSAKLSDINFNPFWNAPVSIVQKDIIPKLISNPHALEAMSIRVFDGYDGPEVDPTTVDWTNTPAERYFFRQDPGEGNAMASVKINFPSPFGVYMHDTPQKELFAEASRYFSSGCVRVEQVHTLVEWIFNGQDGWTMQRIEDVSKSKERIDVKIAEAPDLRWIYLTAWASSDGRVHFRPDVYDLDASGFVIGQPLPVGETDPVSGLRWVEKVVPRVVTGKGTAAASPAGVQQASAPAPGVNLPQPQ